ncbi:BT4734/BF3469 family protein [Bacteroides mediterraneensis]|uniref:BT4734/BF3469 family protein n=1 Tax=Bacteroides mediterraneensis TaxID=1841856 RepID=UPI00195C70DE|nr:VapE domain-containing protein [Bacteroides mediterraneensis]MBM6781268.1 virulence protein E [Bacteroides mediterraneensis]
MKKTLLSLFKGYSDTVPVPVTLSEVVRLIREDKMLADHTEKYRYYRSQGQRWAADREKAACPCFAVAVRFEKGKRKADIGGWTGLTMVDFDHLPKEQVGEVFNRVCGEPHTLLAYTTISGEGVRVVCGYELEKETSDTDRGTCYTRVFNEVNTHYGQLTGCSFDPACKNSTRLSGLAYDEQVYFCPEAELFRFHPNRLLRASPRNGRVERVVARIREELERQGVVYAPHHHNEYIMRMGYLMNEFGLPLKQAVAWADGRFPEYDGDVAAIFRSCYADTEAHGRREAELHHMRKGKKGDSRSPLAGPDEIEQFLTTQAEFRKNVVTGKEEMRYPNAREFVELTDRLVNSLWSRMTKEGHNVRLCDVHSVLESEFVPEFNPFVQYFQSLPEWDGTTDYIGQLTATVQVEGDAALFDTCFRKWLVASVVSLMVKEVTNHEILVLVGRQGCYKTTWLARLLPPELRRYFCVRSNNGRLTKDDNLALSEFALICLEEIDELRQSELNQLKALVTLPAVNERRAYAHYKENRPHIASFCGTTNHSEFLNDPTGSRRWLPFTVKHIDDPYTHPVDYAGVYAQALSLWKTGFRYWFDEKEIAQVNARNERFETASLETDLVLASFRVPMPGEECLFLTVGEILQHISGSMKNPLSAVKVGLALRKAGFEHLRVGGKRGYRVVMYTCEEVNRNRRALGRFTENPSA